MVRAELDPKKMEIVRHVDGPLLVIAGPGAGKTTAIVERVVHLIGVEHVAPESIFVSTFTEKAARELMTRISRRLMEEHLDISPTEMYIGTMHSLFLRILKDCAEFTRLKKNCRTFDDFEQKYFVYCKMYDFMKIENLDLVLTAQSRWTNADRLCALINKVREEAIDPARLSAAEESEVRALGAACSRYVQMLEDENAIDFSAIQSEMLTLVETQPQVLAALQEKLRHLIVDEYQDTNTIQERILLKLAGTRGNICVVGDEDQSIYRFRGASVRNILQFTKNFSRGRCKTVVLDTNYRSHPDIIRFYNRWMDGCDWKDGKNRFRYDKTIAPRTLKAGESFDACPCVIRLSGENVERWCEEVRLFIETMQREKVVTDLNQIAFLFHSVKNKDVVRLVDYLEARGIGVFSPRSAQFFQRDVIRLMIGLFFFLFPQARSIPDDMDEFQGTTAAFYRSCMQLFVDTVKHEPQRHADLLAWAKRSARRHQVLARPTDYSFLTLFYEALKFPLFADVLSVDHDGTPKTSRDAFNLALFSRHLAKFEFIYSIDVLNPKWLDRNLKHFFVQYLHFLHQGGVEEFEDYEQPIPSGCVSVMTIHQSKGLEFPVTIVGSLNRTPRRSWTALDALLEAKYLSRPTFEPIERTKFYDFWREYYVAFSRPQNLLVLTGPTPARGQRDLGKTFDPYVADLPDWKSGAFTCRRLHLATVKPSAIKNAYAFTSDILLYENCPLQYMAYKYLGFAPHRQAATMFGSLVHQTIEDVHKAHLRGESFDQAKIEQWFNLNYAVLSRAMKAYLDPNRRAVALAHVTRYVERGRGTFANIVAAEYDVSIPTETFILHGVIDLLRGEGDTVELVDFKTDRKPDVNNLEDMVRAENYRRQLEIYSHIVEAKSGKKVSKMHLYYTRAEDETPYVTWDYDRNRVAGTLQSFGRTVAKIERHQFSNAKVKKCARLCDGCDMRFYCGCK